MVYYVFPGRGSNFQVRPYQEEEFDGLPYDYDSVMHYRAVAFSRDDISPTIVPQDTTAFFRIGQRDRYSYYDLAKLNRLYKCGSSYILGDKPSQA
ncbi:hypothetical protein PR048_030464 [Dryococelus australis]|uniref:Metalloendopeptidase n=1 Tax=Dryococelus australis TaxID=614101 RepID=A0ABQ9G9I9_9NEOP|nr:hypothetical protein PR048_030464 [Dryococelus australis]